MTAPVPAPTNLAELVAAALDPSTCPHAVYSRHGRVCRACGAKVPVGEYRAARYIGVPDLACNTCGRPTGSPTAKYCRDHRFDRNAQRRYPLTPEREAFLRTHYRPNVPGVARRVAAKMGVSVSLVHQWARRLDICPPREARRWTPEEDAFLEQHIGTRSPAWIAKRLNRSTNAVEIKANRRAISLKDSREWMTPEDVAEGFGSYAATVRGWIRQGLLGASPYGAGRISKITREAVREFVRRHPTAFEIWRVNQTWFLDIVFGGRLGEPRQEGKADA